MVFPSKVRAIDIMGCLCGSTGWTMHSLGFARAVNEIAEVRFRTRNAKEALAGLLSKDCSMHYRGLTKAAGDFGIVIIGQPIQAQRTSLWNVWETTELPESQKKLCNRVDFVWTPSTWGRANLIANGIEPDKIAVVPEGVDTDFFTPGVALKRSRKFRFLTVGKWENRKCMDGLVRAFTEEFGSGDDVELYLQASNPYVPGFSIKKMLAQAGISNQRNIIIGKNLSRRSLRSIYRAADCFVLPTRAEGWGLPLLESMACGVPVIVTRYSAPLDYVTEENGYLLDVARMVDAHDSQFNISTGQWAEPDISHLRFLMRQCVQNPDALHAKGLAARKTARQFSWRNSAQIALQTIDHHLKALEQVSLT